VLDKVVYNDDDDNNNIIIKSSSGEDRDKLPTMKKQYKPEYITLRIIPGFPLPHKHNIIVPTRFRPYVNNVHTHTHNDDTSTCDVCTYILIQLRRLRPSQRL